MRPGFPFLPDPTDSLNLPLEVLGGFPAGDDRLEEDTLCA
jgi:hypothetical protein